MDKPIRVLQVVGNMDAGGAETMIYLIENYANPGITVIYKLCKLAY